MPIQQYSNTYVFLFTALSSLTITNQNDKNGSPLWTWKCIKAIPACMPFKPYGMSQSLATCNMICGLTQLWPQPTGPVSLSPTAVPVRPDMFKLRTLEAPSKVVRKHVHEAFSLMINDLERQKPLQKKQKVDWWEVLINVKIVGSVDPRMQMDTDESYRLTVKSVKTKILSVEINARSFCGARHAFETLAQLVWWDPYMKSFMTLNEAIVVDAPRFSYRGLMLDTARNFYSVVDLLRIIDAMGANKLNTFHWHVSDAHAFSVQFESLQELAAWGALGASAVYSPADVRAVVRHARLRGVRVVMELSMPARAGRAWDWGRAVGYDPFSHCSEEHWNAYCDEPPCGQLNPRNLFLMQTLLHQIYAEIIGITGVDDIFHLGGDGISVGCWREHFNGTDWMDLWVQFTKTALERLSAANGNRKHNLTLIWMSPLSESIKSDLDSYIPYLGLQIRSATRTLLKEVSELGLRTILSDELAWDFNNGEGQWYVGDKKVQYNSWQRMYEHRPWSEGAEGVVGGEGTVWSGEGGPELEPRVWPRAAALAERLWSDGARNVSRSTWARLSVHRERLVARGFHPAPLHSTWCSHNLQSCWNIAYDDASGFNNVENLGRRGRGRPRRAFMEQIKEKDNVMSYQELKALAENRAEWRLLHRQELSS